MAEKVTIARPYARAAFDYAREHKTFAAWSQLLTTAAAVVADERVKNVLNSPSVAAADLAAMIADIAGAKDEHARNFIGTLAANRRLALLPEIAGMFAALRAEVENVADVQVTSASPLDEAQQQRLIVALKKRLKRDVRLHVDIDSSLMGGAIVRTGDLVIDGSLRARLERLNSAIAS
jgi:F-type H+-transporting ATPase subunit delta